MKSLLITGASGGIGAAAARLFAENGCSVVINYFKNKTAAETLAETLQKRGFTCAALGCDVSDYAQVLETVKKTETLFGGVDVLVNNAGISSQKMLCDTSGEQWDRIFGVNIKGVFNCCKAVMPYMIQQKRGRIINVSSMWGVVGASCEVAYSASKAAVIGFTKALAKELGPSNIQVNCISPGVIDTPMNGKLGAQVMEELRQETPLMRIGSPDDVARAMVYLASENADFITGQNLNVNGGFVI